MGMLSNKIKRDKLKPGDHIYFWRDVYLYFHHGHIPSHYSIIMLYIYI
jgi:hypothetical protein